MEQSPPRYKLSRRILFPYSGEDVLTTRQALRVIFAWILTFPLSMALFTLAVALVKNLSWQKTLFLLLVAFIFGAFVFGLLAWLTVTMSNQSARIRQQWLAAKANNTSGGRYGS
jgi:lipopolysaccharide export LptBFGC system permease protein LptF